MCFLEHLVIFEATFLGFSMNLDCFEDSK